MVTVQPVIRVGCRSGPAAGAGVIHVPMVPELQLRYSLWGQHEALYAQWRIEYDRANPPPKIENVRHVHDPAWRTRFVSIQAAHDHVGLIWKATAIAFGLAQLAIWN